MLQRGFIQFVLKPIVHLLERTLSQRNDSNKTNDSLDSMLNHILFAVNNSGTPLDVKLNGKFNFNWIMKEWVPAGDELLNICINHLPSPFSAQLYRFSNCYTGDSTSDEAKYIKNCDLSNSAPLSMHICKMIPTAKKGFIAFGRVFSGTLHSGEEIRILGADYQSGKKHDLFIKKVRQIVMLTPNNTKEQEFDILNYCPAGKLINLFC